MEKFFLVVNGVLAIAGVGAVAITFKYIFAFINFMERKEKLYQDLADKESRIIELENKIRSIGEVAGSIELQPDQPEKKKRKGNIEALLAWKKKQKNKLT